MVIIEVVGGVLFAMLVLATASMGVFGGLGMLGVVRLVRCPTCGHLTTASGTAPPDHCAHCRHAALYHPLQALHQPDAWHRGALAGVGMAADAAPGHHLSQAG